jgi:hypothetical protein
LYDCETLSLTLRKKVGIRMFESILLRIIFGSKRDKVTEDWRELHNEKPHDS